MRTMIIALAFAAAAAAAHAQTPSAPPPAAGKMTPSTPPVDCRAQAQSKGLRGQEARDSVAVCAAERRLACIKEAVDRKIVGASRRDFMRDCAGRPDRGKSKT